MAQYTVKAGQNIYDVAMTLYGSVEGIFYLLVANEWLNLETTLTSGMKLEYSDDLVINSQIPIWFNSNNRKIKNGERTLEPVDIETFVKEHIQSQHPNIFESLQEMSPDEQSMYWELLIKPRMIINQQEQTSAIKLKLRNNSHLIIDWGDYSHLTIVEGDEYKEVEHFYKSNSRHVVTLYGDFSCDLLDLTESNGVHYPLDTIYVSEFKTNIKLDSLNKLIIPS